jgi:chromosomal replication initiator protein
MNDGASVNAKQIWQAALGELQIQLSRPNFETWLRQAVAVSIDDERFVVRAHSTFAAEWLDRRLRPQIEQTLRHIVGHPIALEVIVGHAPRGAAAREAAADAVSEPSLVLPPVEEVPEPVRRAVGPRSARVSRAGRAVAAVELAPEPSAPVAAVLPVASLVVDDRPSRGVPSPEGPWAGSGWQPNPNYTFATFTVGKSNQTAHAAAVSVAGDPGRGYNPLFIYGGVGLGKTHLLHAIANVVVRQGLRTLYVSAEDFTNEMVKAIMEHRTEDFRLRYRTIEVLLVDDVQFIAGKEATQEEFFHTFNALHNVGHQIVLTSDRPPKAIANLAERLQSRFAWGLAVDVQLPDLETRRAILQTKAALRGVKVPDEVVVFLANTIQSNIRELEGGLNRVVAYSSMTNQPMSVALARAAIEDLVQSAQKRLVSPADVIETVCRYYKVDARALRGKARDKEVVRPRQVAMYLMRQKTQASLVDVGRELGRDHSTVLHGCERIQAEAQADVQLRRDLDAIEEMLRQVASR